MMTITITITITSTNIRERNEPLASSLEPLVSSL